MKRRQLERGVPPREEFGASAYQRHNARRLEHLASLQIPVAGLNVLEVGAGTGDHTSYFLDRGCQVTVTEARDENLEVLRSRYPDQDVRHLDLEEPEPLAAAPFDAVYCYGLLYHLADPTGALLYLSEACAGLLLLETCVSFGADFEMHPIEEDSRSPSQSLSGRGCRPTRPWVYRELRRWFPHVYLPVTQPNHEQFPLDWDDPSGHEGLSRSIFIASRTPLPNDQLTEEIPQRQRRHP